MTDLCPCGAALIAGMCPRSCPAWLAAQATERRTLAARKLRHEREAIAERMPGINPRQAAAGLRRVSPGLNQQVEDNSRRARRGWAGRK